MQRQRGELVPIAEALADLPGHVKAICEATPQALHHFTQADQVNQLVTAREADPDRGFMARTMVQAAVALTQLIRPPGFPVQFSPANYALLSRPTNSEFDDKPPDDELPYWGWLPDDRTGGACQLAGVETPQQR